MSACPRRTHAAQFFSKDDATVMAQRVELILDIGTHKVLALAVRPKELGVEVLASAFVRHSERSMRDGQVHDVPNVARTVRRAVDYVSRAVGTTFSGAHIAAAGRALKTARGGAERSESHSTFISTDLARELEWEAVADAQQQLLESLPTHDRSKGFYCIAHTVVESRLDGDVIGSLAGQRGKLFSVEVLATFLPGVVVDSLEAVLAGAGLEMHSLTLEPVAALEAVIPSTMRHLHLALVDIGAGTSDIALTGGGMVQAFGMVPRGGDAVTEAVSKQFLLDFHVAEYVKRVVSAGDAATVDNVLGTAITVTPEQMMEAVRDTVESLAGQIAEVLGQWTRDRLPDALLLVGGGSHTPGLARTLAQRIGLDEARVAVRDRRAVRDAFGEERLAGADVVTALGIALRAVRGKQMPPIRVRVNDRPVSLFQRDRCTVREAARIVGVPLAQLIGRPGPGITVTFNGVVTPLPGQRGEPATVYVNGERATLDTRLHNQDEVALTLPAPGGPPRIRMADMARRWLEQRSEAGESTPHIIVNGVRRPVPLWFERNGRPAELVEFVHDRDVIEVRFVATARELLTALRGSELATVEAAAAADATSSNTATPHAETRAEASLPGDASSSPTTALERDYIPPVGKCTVNGHTVDLSQFATLLRNGAAAHMDDPVADGDVWEYRPDGPVTVARVLEHVGIAAQQSMTIILNGVPTTVSLPADVRINGRRGTPDEHVRNDDDIEARATQATALYQLLPYAGVSLDSVANGRLIILVRGEQAGFTTPISDGDDVVIRYEQ